ncbi:lung seven transmembrane receptor-domain-containing protein [Syncephalastrum racemosum]|uniref:Lung seven transmembrane receptor-domain-containing protein n=1 Tax=Syncephalastrum racemosum TaxID=13706 RepID=A0A1X2HT57_SYNRA|nr:lung seven transmembrane receptor-domain-containing protein [Syncephalastrum racemosum]
MKAQWLVLALFCFLSNWHRVHASDLILDDDDRKTIQVATFGFLSGGFFHLQLDHFKLSHPEDSGRIAFYIRKGRRMLDDDSDGRSDPNEQGPENEDAPLQACFLDNSYIENEVEDGTAVIQELKQGETSLVWNTTVDIKDEGVWQILLISCSESTMSGHIHIDQVNPNNNHLSAGDTPLPVVYAVSALSYGAVAAYWTWLLFRRDAQVFRAHWLMLVLVCCVLVYKALQSAKYYYKMIGILTEGWRIGFYIFASLKGLLSILIIVLLASGWMFIKPFLSVKDKRIISVVIPLQVVANIASAIGNEAAVGSTDYSFWNMIPPLIDLAACGVVLWTILQTRKHLSTAGSAAEGKERNIVNGYKLWSSFYVITLVYIYVTRVLVQLLQASLPFRYVSWLGEAVSEMATLSFYIFIGYKFRPYPNNPYTQVPSDDLDLELENGIGTSRAVDEDTLRMTVSRSAKADKDND